MWAMSYATYGPRCVVHDDRYGNVKSKGPNLWVVLHTSEQRTETHDSAEDLCSYMGQPGDRIKRDKNGKITQQYGSSYHAVFDTDRVIPLVPYGIVSYSAGGGNAQGIHACFPGKAAQTRAQWLDPISRAMIRQCAAWLCDVADDFDIPIDRKMAAYEMKAGAKGLGDHYTVTLAFGKSTHTDVGSGFPWDVLFADVRELLAPPPTTAPAPDLEGDVMKAIYYPGPAIRARTDINFAAFESGIVRHASGPDTSVVAWGPVPRVSIDGVAHFNQLARAANHMAGAGIALL